MTDELDLEFRLQEATARGAVNNIASALISRYNLTRQRLEAHDIGVIAYSTRPDLFNAVHEERLDDECRLYVSVGGDTLHMVFANGTSLYVLLSGTRTKVVAFAIASEPGPLWLREDEYKLGEVDSMVLGELSTALSTSGDESAGETIHMASLAVKAGEGRIYAS